MRRAVAVVFIAVGFALVVGLLLSPNSDVVRLPPPTSGPEIVPTPSDEPEPDNNKKPADPTATNNITPHPTSDPIGDHDCGPECYEEHKPPRP